MLYARVVDGIVIELFTPPDGVPIDNCFVPQFVAQFVDASNASPPPQQRWTYTDGKFYPPT